MLFCFSGNIFSQEIFNKLYDFGLTRHTSFGIEQIEDKYYVSGLGLDTTLLPLEHGAFLMSTDKEGALINTIVFDDGDINTTPNFANLTREILYANDHVYLHVGDISQAFIIKSNLGLDSFQIVSAYRDSMLSFGPDLYQTVSASTSIEYPENKLSFSSGTFRYDEDVDQYFRRALIVQVDPYNDDSSEFFYFDLPDDDSFVSVDLKIDTDGQLLIIGGTEEGKVAIAKINEEMQVQEAYSYDVFYGVNYLQSLVQENGEIYIIGTELFDTGLLFHSKPVIIKVNSNYEMAWQKDLSHDFREYSDRFIGFVDSHNDDGFILSGEHNDDGSNHYSNGIIAKIDYDGNQIWRKDVFTIQNVPRDCFLWETIQTDDGHYMSVGYNRLGNLNDTINSYTQVWLLKFDDDGNVLTDGLSSIETDFSDQITIYPNPTQDIVMIDQQEVEGIRYQLYDGNGKLIIDQSHTLYGPYIRKEFIECPYRRRREHDDSREVQRESRKNHKPWSRNSLR